MSARAAITLAVGVNWTDANGNTWEITQCHPFGLYRVMDKKRARQGEMRGSDIRDEIHAARARDQSADNTPRCIVTGKHRNDGRGMCIDCDYPVPAVSE